MLHSGVQAFHGTQFGKGNGPIFIDLLSCDGTETDISMCQLTYLHSCSHDNDASVICHGKLLLTVYY